MGVTIVDKEQRAWEFPSPTLGKCFKAKTQVSLKERDAPEYCGPGDSELKEQSRRH